MVLNTCREIKISIHALREEGDGRLGDGTDVEGSISIHALREEGDSLYRHVYCGSTLFLSTPSARRATIFNVRAKTHSPISIHALREEGDCWRTRAAP